MLAGCQVIGADSSLKAVTGAQVSARVVQAIKPLGRAAVPADHEHQALEGGRR